MARARTHQNAQPASAASAPSDQGEGHPAQQGHRGRSRGNGEGSIYQRKSDGRWCCAITLDDGRQKVLYGKTRIEVAAKLTAALGNKQKGLPVAYERQTVAMFLRRWLEECARPKLRPQTYQSYRFLVEQHLIPGLGREQLATLSPQTVQAFLNKKAVSKRRVGGRNLKSRDTDRQLSPRTVQYLRAVLRKALSQAMKWDMVGRNAAALVDVPRAPKAEVTPMTPDEARRFLAHVRGDRLEALYTVAMAMGLREGEALGLRWSDVDLDAGVLRVRQTLIRNKVPTDGGKEKSILAFDEPKTERSRRTLHLPAVSVAALQRHEDRQKFEKKVAGTRWRDNGLVFATEIGTPIDPTNVIRRFHQALDGAKLPRRPFHDLRHTCASLLLAQGVDLRLIMEILGHSQIALTANLYTHVMPAARQEIAGRMDALLGGIAGAS